MSSLLTTFKLVIEKNLPFFERENLYNQSVEQEFPPHTSTKKNHHDETPLHIFPLIFDSIPDE